MSKVAASGFDYNSLDGAARDSARDAATRIRMRMSRTAQDIIEIGRDLIVVKKAVGHGGFLKWIEAEFEMSDQAARRFMQVAEQYGKSNTVLNLPAGALYALAAPSTPPEVREKVEARVKAGEKVSLDDIKALKIEWQQEKEQWLDERKELKRQIDDAKFKVRDAKSIKNDVQQQLTDLQTQLADARNENHTLRLELEHKAALVAPVPQPAATLPDLPDLQSVDAQVEVLLADWNRVSERARQEFLRRVDARIAA